ncbi:hypothetical protein H2204_006536 [Knufia peltigerae]|uniref:Uncharacterized protein n=1 Tax=Knufia peltigerae TaxID=1002370 RepID=A0AA38Y3C9_9EURO|nr:hypothetical protein H2204_006536 [Knufia peltigerae]
MKPQPQPTEAPAEDTSASPESSYVSSSAVTSPQASQWTNGSIATDDFSPTAFSTSCSTFSHHGLARLSTLESFSDICHERWDLLDYLFRNVLGQVSETGHFDNIAWPGSIMARHILKRKSPSQVLLAISSLCRDHDAGHQQPTSETIALMLRGILLLKEQLQKSDGINGDSILTMTNLWTYEAVLGFDIVDNMTTQSTRANSAASLQSIQTHIDGLRRSITHMGGLNHLPPEAMWSVAW